MAKTIIPNTSPGQPDEAETLDLATIPGLREHFNRSDEFPILVFRAARAIRVVLNPFPSIWRIVSTSESRSLIAGRNTYPTALEVKAGDQMSIVPIMSAMATTGPRIQVPAELPNDIGVLETTEEVRESDEGEDLDTIDTATEADIDDVEADTEGLADADVDAALSDLMAAAIDSEAATGREYASYPGATPGILAGWFTVAHVGGVA